MREEPLAGDQPGSAILLAAETVAPLGLTYAVDADSAFLPRLGEIMDLTMREDFAIIDRRRVVAA